MPLEFVILKIYSLCYEYHFSFSNIPCVSIYSFKCSFPLSSLPSSSLLSPLLSPLERVESPAVRRCSGAIWGIILLFCFGFTWPLIIRLAALSSGELICFLKRRESKLTKLYLRKICMGKSHSSRKQRSKSVHTVKGTPEREKQWDPSGKNKNKIKRLRRYMKQPWNWLPPTHLFSFWYWLSLTLSAFCPGVHRSQTSSVDQWQIQTSGDRATYPPSNPPSEGWKELPLRTCAYS